MGLPVYEVDVPIRSITLPGLSGVHVFTGPADSRSAALRLAHEAHDAARTAQETGLEVSGMRRDGWTANGYRPGWEPDWLSATAGRWYTPLSPGHAATDDGDFDM